MVLSVCCQLVLTLVLSFLLSADTTASGYKNAYVTTSTTDTHVKGTGKGHKVAEVHTTTDTATHHPITKTIFNSPPPSPKPPPPSPNPPPPPKRSPPPPPSPSPPPPPSPSPGAYVGNGGVALSYFNDAVMATPSSSPYTLQFSNAKVYNVGTQYFIGNMMTPTEKANVFTVPVVGGSGTSCPNGVSRSGQLTVTCSATNTSFSVNEYSTCKYDMQYVTTQQCPPGTQYLSPPPPAPLRPAALSLATCPSFSSGGWTYSLCYPSAVTQSQTTRNWLGISSTTTYQLGTPTWNPNGYYDLSGGSNCGSAGARSGRMYAVCNPLQSQSTASVTEPQTCRYNVRALATAACLLDSCAY